MLTAIYYKFIMLSLTFTVSYDSGIPMGQELHSGGRKTGPYFYFLNTYFAVVFGQLLGGEDYDFRFLNIFGSFVSGHFQAPMLLQILSWQTCLVVGRLQL